MLNHIVLLVLSFFYVLEDLEKLVLILCTLKTDLCVCFQKTREDVGHMFLFRFVVYYFGH